MQKWRVLTTRSEADQTGLRLPRSWVLQIKNLSAARNFKREIIMNFCHKPSMRPFFHFLIIRSESVMLHIAERQRNNASYLRKQMLQPSSPCGLRRAKSVKAVLWSTLCLARLRRVKHTKVWSGTACHEAHLRCMKRTFGAWSNPSDYEARLSAYEANPFQASCFFAQNLGKKMGW